MTTRTKTLAGAGIVLALALTGCNGPAGNGESSASADAPSSASQTTSAAGSSASAASSSPSSAPTTAAASSSARPAAFEPVRADAAPKTEREGQEMAWKTVQRYYEAQGVLLRERDPAQVDELSAIVSGPYLGQETAALKRAFEKKGRTYEGESKPELIQATAGPLIWPDGSRTNYSSVTVRVCEDNSGVMVKDEKGKEQPTGADRYVLDFSTMWNEDSKTWTVTGSSEPSEDDPGVTTC